MKTFIVNIAKTLILTLISWLTPRDKNPEEDFSKKIKKSWDLTGKNLKVWTPDGWMPIKTIFKTRDYEIYEVVLENGYKITCADHHRFYDTSHNCLWVTDFVPGDVIITDKGPAKIVNIRKTGCRSEMYDIEIDSDSHEYYSNGILTHNTTTTAIFATWFTCFHVDKTFAIIANKDKIAAEVFGKVKAIIEDLPFFLKPGCYGFGPASFSFDNGCRAVYSTATIDSIQGFSVDCLYIDEFAYIKNSKAREFWINVYPTISSMDTSKVIITSTPNGKNLFFELWQGAVTGKNGLKPFRVDWWQAPGHDEKWAAQERAMIGEEGFAQQYGLSFDAHMKSLLQSSTFHYLQKIEQNFVAGLLSIGSDFDECFRWSTQFRYSLKKDWFLLSIDIGEGLGKDSSVIKIKKMIRLFNGVYDGSGLPQTHYKLVTVGVFESNTIQIPDFAKVFVALCRRLNLEQTRIVVERNTYGDLFMLHVDNICEDSLDGFEIPLESYAKFKRNEDAKFEKGLRVNPSNKKFGVAAYQEYMNSKFNIETDSLSIEQIREFGEDERGNYKASVGHDDLVMPEVNLSYYIKTNNIGWREFLNEFADKALIDAYNYNLILKIDTNAVRDMKRDIAADNELEDISTEYDLELLNPNEENSNDNEYLLIGKTKEDRTALIKRGGGDDEYSLINEAVKKIPKPPRERSQHEQYFNNEYRPRGHNKPKISAQDLLNLA